MADPSRRKKKKKRDAAPREGGRKKKPKTAEPEPPPPPPLQIIAELVTGSPLAHLTLPPCTTVLELRRRVAAESELSLGWRDVSLSRDGAALEDGATLAACGLTAEEPVKVTVVVDDTPKIFICGGVHDGGGVMMVATAVTEVLNPRTVAR